MSKKLGFLSRRVWHSANATNTPGEVIVFGGSTNFFINPLEIVETNQVAIFWFVPQKLKTLCLNIVLCVLKDDPETWMPCITRLPREMRHDINNRLAFQGQGSDKPVKHGKPAQNTFFE